MITRLANGLTADQHSRISALFERDGDDLNRLEILRASPLKRRQSDLWTHLDRLDTVRDLDLSSMPPKSMPATQLERLARIARRTKPSTIAALKEPRRTATVAALFYTLEASAQDDAIELGDALIADLFREARLAQANHRHAHQRSLDAAIMLLRDLASFVTADDTLSHDAWRDMVYQQMPKKSIEEAILAVDALVKPAVGKPLCRIEDGVAQGSAGLVQDVCLQRADGSDLQSLAAPCDELKRVSPVTHVPMCLRPSTLGAMPSNAGTYMQTRASVMPTQDLACWKVGFVTTAKVSCVTA